MKHKCDGCRYKGEHQEMMFRPFGVCTLEKNLAKAEQAYNADTCPYGKNLCAAECHKQSEGAWNTTPLSDTYPYFTAYSHTCPKCTYTYYDVRKGGYKFCPNCGANMAGGVHET